jgi:hypothetical protein
MLNVVAPGAWVAVRVDVENHGPAVNGELRLAAADGQGSTYSVPVELATGARQEHFLYTQAGPFGARFDVSLRSGATVQATVRVSVEMPQNASRRVYVVAEHPERLTQPIGVALAAKGSPSPRIVTIAPEDLPPRAEAWSSIDLLVWHDIDSARLGPERASALATWLMTGGNLVVFGGSMGTTMFGGFPADLLPYQPENVVDLAPTEIAENFGQLPAGAPAAPAVTGPLAGGTPLWTTSSGQVIGARKAEGQGGVALIGFDPTTEWFAGSEAAGALWLMAVPARASWDSTRLPADDGYLVSALGNLPSVQLPGGDLLLVLIVAYIFTIGPINYAVLRRRDRREWAWLTMPLTIVAFGVAAYGLGVVMKGSNVIVSELAIVEAGVGAQRGEAEVHVGIFSPGRSDLDVHVGPQALVSSAGNQDGSGQGRPLDIVGGDPATLRNFGVNFGAMRTFRAQTSVDVPLLQADLRVAAGKLEGNGHECFRRGAAGRGGDLRGQRQPGGRRGTGRVKDRLRPACKWPCLRAALVAPLLRFRHRRWVRGTDDPGAPGDHRSPRWRLGQGLW